jgi:hypothetical protein
MNSYKEDQLDEKIVIDREKLISLLSDLAEGGGSSVGMPSDDDTGDRDGFFGPYGPGGPRMRAAAPVLVASHVINTAITFDMASKVTQQGEFGQASQGVASSMVSQFVEEICGTRPRRWPFPWPLFKPEPQPWRKVIDQMYKQPRGVDLVIAGLQFRKAASELEDGELKQSFEAAANKLMETGLSR